MTVNESYVAHVLCYQCFAWHEASFVLYCVLLCVFVVLRWSAPSIILLLPHSNLKYDFNNDCDSFPHTETSQLILCINVRNMIYVFLSHSCRHILFAQNRNVRAGRTKFKARFVSRSQTVKLQKSKQWIIFTGSQQTSAQSSLFTALKQQRRHIWDASHSLLMAVSSSSMMERRASRHSTDTVRVPTTSLLSSTSSTANTQTHTRVLWLFREWFWVSARKVCQTDS